MPGFLTRFTAKSLKRNESVDKQSFQSTRKQTRTLLPRKERS